MIETPIETFSFKFRGKPAVCKFVKIPVSGHEEACERLFSGPLQDIGLWKISKRAKAMVQPEVAAVPANGNSTAGSGWEGHVDALWYDFIAPSHPTRR
jgi:hypothetical protein